MSDDLHRSPVAFTPNVEVRADDEAETIQGLNEQLRLIQETTAKDYGTAVRGVHAKGHAIVNGKLEVLSGIAPSLAPRPVRDARQLRRAAALLDAAWRHPR